jgi:hypothetical protein
MAEKYGNRDDFASKLGIGAPDGRSQREQRHLEIQTRMAGYAGRSPTASLRRRLQGRVQIGIEQRE